MVSTVQEKPQVSSTAEPAETLIEKLKSLSTQAIDTEDLRIRMGRRYAHGVTGNERRKLSDAQAETISEAIKRPVTEGANFEDYIDSIPSIRISAGDDVLFSQESNGVVSVNSFSIEQQSQSESTVPEPQIAELKSTELESPDGDRMVEAAVFEANSVQPVAATQPTSYAAASMPPVATIIAERASSEPTGDEQLTDTARAADLLVMACEISQPLESRSTSEPIETSLGAYTIQIEGKDATVLKGDEVVLQAVDGQVTQSSLPEKDAEALQGWLEKSSSAAEAWTVSVQTVDPTLIKESAPPAIIHQPVHSVSAITVAQQQIEALPEGRSKQFFQKLGASLDQGIERATKTAQALHQDLKEHGKALHQDLKDHGRANAQKAVEKATVLTGRGLEKAGQWLASRPETIREQRAARNALAMYKEGNNRTNETSFEHGGFKIAFDAKTNQYSLSDAKTDSSLMSFKEESSRIPGQIKIALTEKADISREQYQSFDAVARSGEVVRGSAEAETNHAAQSAGFADFCQKFTLAQESSDCRTKHYRIQTSGNDLSISSLKSGQEIYCQENEQVTSRLGQEDFKNLDLAQSIMERPAAPLETGTHSKTSSIELD